MNQKVYLYHWPKTQWVKTDAGTPPYAECTIHWLFDPAYAAVRELFRMDGFDSDYYGTKAWNPLSGYIQPGQTVLLKPNLVLHESQNKNEDYYSVVTHPGIIRAIVDYVYLALKGQGKIFIGDAPVNNADFGLICEKLGLNEIQSAYQSLGFVVELVDFRLYTMKKDEAGVIRNQQYTESMENHIVIKVDEHSRLRDSDQHFKDYRVTEYNGYSMPMHHNRIEHRYCFHKSVFEADVVIGLPKIKSHRKTGYTCAMKNWVGLNGNKDWLPHHTKGSAENGGDEYLYRSFRKALIAASWDIRWKLKNILFQKILLVFEQIVRHSRRLLPFKDQYWEGSWYGNRTVARMINDINIALLYSNRNGELQAAPQRNIFYLVDGIICGEGEGPLAAKSKACRTVLWGSNAYAIDRVVTQLIGFDHRKIETLRLASESSELSLIDFAPDNIDIITNLRNKPISLNALRSVIGFNFEPAQGWKGHIEINNV